MNLDTRLPVPIREHAAPRCRCVIVGTGGRHRDRCTAPAVPDSPFCLDCERNHYNNPDVSTAISQEHP